MERARALSSSRKLCCLRGAGPPNQAGLYQGDSSKAIIVTGSLSHTPDPRGEWLQLAQNQVLQEVRLGGYGFPGLSSLARR